ncbi:MAG: hypothetical protein R3Y15_01430 [Rikenellaceae bacterium]
MIIAGMVTYRYIAPDHMGIWTTITSFTIFAIFLRLGIANGMNRELPYSLGKNDEEKAYSYAETTLFYSLLITAIIVFACILFYVFYNFDQHNNYQHYYEFAFFAIALKIIIEPYYTYLSSTFRTNNSFNKLSTIQIILATTRLVSLPMIIAWNFEGYILRDILLTLLNITLFHYWRPLPHIRPAFKFLIFKELFSVGFRMFVTSYIVSLADTLPRFFIIKEGVESDMGIISPVFLMFSTLALIPNTLANYLYPKFSQALGRGEEFSYFWSKMKLIYILSFITSVLGAVAIYFGIDFVIQLFPKYLSSVPYIKLSCIALLFIGYKLSNTLFTAFKKWNYLWGYTLSYSGILLLSLFVCSYYFKDILNAVIVALSISYFSAFIISIILTYRLKQQ